MNSWEIISIVLNATLREKIAENTAAITTLRAELDAPELSIVLG